VLLFLLILNKFV